MYAYSEPSNIVPFPIAGRAAYTGQTRLLDSLRTAIEQDELFIQYQPRHDIARNGSHLLEALVRWNRPGAGVVYPGAFIDTAIDHGLIYLLDQWVFRRCCEDLVWMRRHIDPGIRIAVNISAPECESRHHLQQLIATSESYGLDLASFEFELTESTFVRDPDKIAIFCETVISKGAEVSLDDFGTGQSPLSNLCRYPVSTVKIDRSFVHRLGTDRRNRILVRHLVTLAHELDLSVVAEGIETGAQYELLADMGCDQLQGYFICRPLARPMLLPWLSN